MDSKLVTLTVISLCALNVCSFLSAPTSSDLPVYKQSDRNIASTEFKPRKKPIIVAVIDTGISDRLAKMPYLCKVGHKDFTGTGLNDNHGHGSHISGLIQQYVTNNILSKTTTKSKLDRMFFTKSPYCQVILKYYDPTQQNADTLAQEIQAIQYAINIKVDYINFSGGGTTKSQEEIDLIKKALDSGIKIVVAAGNEDANIDEVTTKDSDIKYEHYYPANDDPRITIVGNLSQNNQRCPSSNYGSTVNAWEIGENVMSTTINGFGIMTGTSQATAIKTGKLIREALLH